MALIDELRDWREAGEHALDDQASRVDVYRRYYRGDFDMPVMLDTAERQAFRRYLQQSEANWCSLVINAVAERLQITGFRFGGSSEAAWDIWQANGMDADAELAQTEGLVSGVCPVLVQQSDRNPTGVEITLESPDQAVVLYAPGTQRIRQAAYKRWENGGGSRTEVVMLPDVIATWHPNEGEPEVAANPTGEVSMVELIPNPQIGAAPLSELRPAVAIQDRINTTIFNRLVASDYGAFRQVWATGVKLMRETIGQDEATGEPIVKPVAPYDVGANRLLVNENPNGRFGSFPEATLAGYLAAVEQDIQQLAAITQTPPHYLLGQMINISADAIKAAEAGLVSKVRRRALHLGEAWEEIMRLALGIIGDPAATEVSPRSFGRTLKPGPLPS
jgi:hypothetical protein